MLNVVHLLRKKFVCFSDTLLQGVVVNPNISRIPHYMASALTMWYNSKGPVHAAEELVIRNDDENSAILQPSFMRLMADASMAVNSPVFWFRIAKQEDFFFLSVNKMYVRLSLIDYHR